MRARELGAELRKLRESTGLSGVDFAKVVGWSNSKVSRIEFGLRGITETLIFHENTATSSLSYDPLVVPGLLQTERYVRALIGREGLQPKDAKHRIDARMDRQEVLRRRQFAMPAITWRKAALAASRTVTASRSLPPTAWRTFTRMVECPEGPLWGVQRPKGALQGMATSGRGPRAAAAWAAFSSAATFSGSVRRRLGRVCRTVTPWVAYLAFRLTVLA